MIERYYQIAPEIVNKINQCDEHLAIFQRIYEYFILPCVESAKMKDFEKSKEIYLKMVNDLAAQYAN